MAKQIGFLKIIGTIGEITFYEMDGEFYARKKSSLDGKRVKKDPKFKLTMEEAIGFGKASAATREVYWALPAGLRGHGVYGKLTGRMRKLMREGRTAEEAQLQLLYELCAEHSIPEQQDAPKKRQVDGFADQLLKDFFAPEVNMLSDDVSLKKKRYAIHKAISREMSFADYKDFLVLRNPTMRSAKIFLPRQYEQLDERF
jgi:hypothetical protein